MILLIFLWKIKNQSEIDFLQKSIDLLIFFNLGAFGQELLIRFSFQDDRMAVELRVQEVGKADFKVPRRICETQSVVHVTDKASWKVHCGQGGAVGSVPDFLRKGDDHHAQRRTQWGAHGGASDLLVNRGADGKLGHLQGHQDDVFNVTDEDLSGHVECTARAAFDDIACSISRSCFHWDDFVRVGTHEVRKELQSQSPAVDEPVSVDACEEASKVLIVDTWSRKRVKICIFEELDEVENISFGQVVGKRLRQ